MDVSLNVNVFRRYLDYTKRKRTALEITLGPYAVQNMSETSVFHVFVLAWLRFNYSMSEDRRDRGCNKRSHSQSG